VRTATLHPRLEALQYLDFTTHDARPWRRLLEVLEQPESARLDRLASSEPGSTIDRAVAALDSLDPEERRIALETLGQSSDPAAQRAVRTALGHSLLDVRVRAGVAVATADITAALPALVEGLALPLNSEDRTRELVFRTRQTLVGIGQDAVPQLVEALAGANETVLANVADVLGQIGDDTAVPALLSRLADGRKGGFLDARSHVVRALGDIGSPKAADELMEIVSDRRENEYTVRDAIWSLGQIGSADATPFLLEQLPRQPRETQTLIVVVLGTLGDDRAVPALAAFLADNRLADDGLSKVSRKPMSEHAADALRMIGSPSALATLDR
jgi:HEAT repeat protein